VAHRSIRGDLDSGCRRNDAVALASDLEMGLSGFVNNGLGTMISKQVNPAMFRAMIVGLRCFSFIGWLFAAAGAIGTCLWIWKALP
jgi:hypothetical protein